MENATKALIIAAGMLIAIMVISLGVYLFSIMSEYTTSAQQQIIDDRVLEFNNNFVKYDGRSDLTVHDVITIANYARQNNEKYGLTESNRENDNDYYISVILKVKNKEIYIETPKINNKTSEEFFNEALKNSQNYIIDDEDKISLRNFQCSVSLREGSARVYKVVITRL